MFSIPRVTDHWPALSALILVAVGCWRLPVHETRLGFIFLMEYGIVLALAVYIVRINGWWAAFIMVTMFSSIYPVYSRFSFLAYYGVVLSALWFTMIVVLVKKSKTSKLLDAICVIACVHVAFQILQAFNLDPLFMHKTPEAQQAVGLMSNRNEVAALIALSVPAFLRPKWLWGLIPLCVGLILAKSMGGILAAACGILFYNIMKDRLYISLALAIMAVFAYGWLVDAPGLERLAVWRIGLETWQQNWLFGSGIGHWKIVFKAPMVTGTRWATAHNDFIQGLFEMGIPFAVLAAGYLTSLIRRYRPPALIPMTALVIIVFNSVVNFTFHIAVTALVAVTWLAILEIYLRKPVPGLSDDGRLPDIAY